jgi:hypothetical protein
MVVSFSESTYRAGTFNMGRIFSAEAKALVRSLQAKVLRNGGITFDFHTPS